MRSENTVLNSPRSNRILMTGRKLSRFPTPVLPGSGSKGYLKQRFRALSSDFANTPSLPTTIKRVCASQSTSRSTATLAYPTTSFMGATSPELQCFSNCARLAPRIRAATSNTVVGITPHILIRLWAYLTSRSTTIMFQIYLPFPRY